MIHKCLQKQAGKSFVTTQLFSLVDLYIIKLSASYITNHDNIVGPTCRHKNSKPSSSPGLGYAQVI